MRVGFSSTPLHPHLAQASPAQAHPAMTLEELHLWQLALDVNQPGEDITRCFDAQPMLPGILLTQNERYLGMISRRRFFERMSRQYALELFSKRPAQVIFETLQSDILEFPAETLVTTAAPICLGRSSEAVYEPMVIRDASGSCSVIDFQHLLIAYAQINNIILEQLQQSRQQAKDTLNSLQSLQQDYSQMLHTEKMASLGQLVAGMAHEVNNPVNFIHGNLSCATEYAQDLLHVISLYQQHYPDPPQPIQSALQSIDLDFLAEDFPKLLSSMDVGTSRIQSIVISMRNFSRLDESDLKVADIHQGIESTLTILKHRTNGQGHRSPIKIEKDYGKLPLLHCYPGQLNQVFMNLLVNAIDTLQEASSENPKILICTEFDADQVLIKITDNGPGISEVVQRSIFDPFFTTKPVGKGTGLGLSISYKVIAEGHGGQLSCQSRLGEGTTFTIALPSMTQQ
ncbi:MAG: ATP-binding protein [Cyanobacteria bacterium P01_F01_bin.53]